MPGFDPGVMPSFGSTFTPANLGAASTSMLGHVFPGYEALSFGLNQLGAELDVRRKQRLMDKQYQMNLEQWNRQNEYDSPAAQMARLRAAGLNPDLIYGQLGNGQAMSQTVSDMDVPASRPDAAIARAVGSRIELEQLALNRASVEADIELKEAQASMYESRSRRDERWIESQDIVDEFKKSGIVLNYADAEVCAARVNEIGAHIEKMGAEVALLQVQRAIAEIEKENKPAWYEATIKEIQAKMHNLNVSSAKINQELIELAQSFEVRLASVQHKERSDFYGMIMDAAASADVSWTYALDSDGKPVKTSGGAAVKAMDIITGFLGRLVGISYNVNDFRNNSRYQQQTNHRKGQTQTYRQPY